jgi:serine/threonine protein kinase
MERALGSRYRLGSLLGSGAMGQVFAGTDAEGGEFACKILRSELTSDPSLVARFLQERSILVSLRHHNLVGVHDLVVEGETVAIVMDLVRGGDLRQRLVEAGTMLPSEVARIGSGVAAALAEVHRAGVVHRDVKPENVLMDGDIPRLTDFGISRLANETSAGRSSLLAGTPQYLAPELADGEEATPAADLYSLGIVLYEMCCGVTPFAGKSMLTVIRQHAEAEPGRPDGIPQPLWDLISWLLAKHPRGRPQSALQVATLLDALSGKLIGAPVALRLEAPPAGIPMAHSQFTQSVAHWPSAPPAGGVVPKKRRGRKVLVAFVATLLVAGGVSAWALLRPSNSGSNNNAVAQPVGTSAQAQAPVAAATVTPTTTKTTVAELTIAPDLVGKTVSAAQDALPSSIKVNTVENVDQRSPDGTVMAQEPKAGEKINGTMTLTVARRAVEVHLDDFRPTTGNWNDQNVAQLGGTTFTHSVSSQVGSCSNTDFVEYNVSKGFRRLVGTGGIDDNSRDSSFRVLLEVYADGRSVFNQTVAFGKPVPIDVDLSGVLRLKIQWQGVSKSCPYGNNIALGEPKLLGLPGEVPSSTPTTSR